MQRSYPILLAGFFSILFINSVFAQYDSLFAVQSALIDPAGDPVPENLVPLDYHDPNNWTNEIGSAAVPVISFDLRCLVVRHMVVGRGSSMYFSGNYDADPDIDCLYLTMEGANASITVDGGYLAIDADVLVSGQNANKKGFFRILADTAFLDSEGNELDPSDEVFSVDDVADTMINTGTVVINNNLTVSGNGTFVIQNGILRILGGNLNIGGGGDFIAEAGGEATIEPAITANDNGTPDDTSDDFETATGGNASLTGGSSLRVEEGALLTLIDQPYYDGTSAQRAGGFLSISGGANSEVVVNGQLNIFQSANTEGNPAFTTERPQYFEDFYSSPEEYLNEVLGLPPLVRIRGTGCQNWEVQVPRDGLPNLTPGCNQNDETLPVVLEEFVAKAIGKAVELRWTTSSEEDNDFFAVERSLDGLNYTKIGMVPGHGTTDVEREYTFTDRRPATGVQFYRLVQTDFDGTSAVFGPLSVRVDALEQEMTVYPNPLRNDVLTIRVHGFETGELVFRIADLNGRTVYSEARTIQRGGTEQVQVDVAGRLQAGMYIVQVVQGGNQFSERLVVTK
jgi:hypothetical protein